MKRFTIPLILMAVVIVATPLLLRNGGPPSAPPKPVIGTVSLSDVDERTVAGARETLADLGWLDGDNVVWRQAPPAGGADRLDALIRDHLDRGVDLLFVSSTPATLAAKRLTRDNPVPVVFCPVNDPVGSGIVDNLQQPGGNITGIRLPQGDQPRLQWLKELAPAVSRVLIPYTPSDKSALASLEQVRLAAADLGLALDPAPVEDMAAMERLAAALPEGVDALFLPRDSTVESRIELWVAAARAHRLPLSAPSYQQVEQGALYTYGFVHHKLGRQAAYLMDKILGGTPPGEVPVETGASFLVINLDSAREIGLEIPPHLLRQAAMLFGE